MANPNGRPAPKTASVGPTVLPRKPTHLGRPIRRKGHRYCRCLCCCLSFLLLTLLILAIVSASLCYFYLRPRLPLLRLETIHVSKFHLSSHAGSTFLDASASVEISASNPNSKIVFSYFPIGARIYIADEDYDISVGTAMIPEFDQEVGSLPMVLGFSAGAKGVPVDDSVGARLREGFRSGDIRYGVEMRSRVRPRVYDLDTFSIRVRVQCQPVRLSQLAKSGVTLPRCHVYLFGL